MRAITASLRQGNRKSSLAIQYMDSSYSNQVKVITIAVAAVIIIFLFFALSPFVIISPGHRGVLMNMGAVQNDIKGEGLHLKWPVYQSVKSIDVRTVKYETQSIAYSRDTQTVDSKIALNYHLQSDRVNKIYQEVGDNKGVEDTIINPAIQEAIKAVVAKFTASELLDRREIVSSEIKTNLSERLVQRYVIVDAFSIMNFDFSDAYEQAVEAKQVAQQNALTEKNNLDKAQYLADQRVAQAKGEAEAIKIQAEAITQQGGEDYVKLKWVEAWSKGGSQVPQIITGENAGSFLFNLGDASLK